MSETYTEKEVMKIGEYVQKKERQIFGLNTAIQSFGGSDTIYGRALNEILIVVYEDRMPGALDLQKLMPTLYPRIKKQVEKKEESGEEPDQQ